MKKKPVTFPFLLCFLFLVLASASAAKAGTGPKMVIKERTYEYGEVRQGQTIEHQFKVKNEGDEALKIKRVAPD
ncbi:MAG: DUF1573 domain-containing protein [Deltaproteobacteria bacterium]|nr:DUF1573 domain-containing protein [Deltaproteobacteria bacterium]MBW2136905.1 DUF1573 domain-containing protein [Deltaproteobacteria bacterium]